MGKPSEVFKHVSHSKPFAGRRTNVFDPFSLDVWDPFDGLLSSALSTTVPTASETSAFANARIDWKETPEAHVFKADLPGLKKEEVKVEVEEGRILQISGERSKEQEEKNDKWHRSKGAAGSFSPVQAAGKCKDGGGES
ncbi:hypothetical protein FNV43_RR05169 [Rhamnella rubrinervis]|uniref:SHSP domain-containing protein n=1 Tax=Rhamnella rubrinervis TaxID=2594499 RepID=A0A8K0HLL6_9ROSA|nr:hypothetical protein FNV43_RR05169 [Rhamnella rubrinervis]